MSRDTTAMSVQKLSHQKPGTTARSDTARCVAAVIAALAMIVAVLAPRSAGEVGASGAIELRAAGQDTQADERATPPVLPSDETFRSHVDLLDTPVDGPAFRRAQEAYDALATQLREASQNRVEVERRMSLLETARRTEIARLRAAGARMEGFGRVAEELRLSISELAVEAFMTKDPTAALAAVSDPTSANDRQRIEVLTAAAADSLIAERDAAVVNAEAAARARAAAQDSIDGIDAEMLELVAALGATQEQAARDAPLLGQLRDDLESERALATVEAVDFQLVALDAYYRAAELTARLDPTCGVPWWAIAGISRVEGRHGTYGGARLDAAGLTDRPIIGIPLTGENGTALIADTDGGALDGDPSIDRAVGPMQFIPETWSRFAADGNDDGVASPHNLYDASLAAAIYLCRSGRGLTDDAALRVAYFSYNQSDAYVTNVLTQARRYEAAVDLGGGIDDG